MHIAPIQTMNSYNKPNFRASFVKDSNGKLPEIIQSFWGKADKTPELFEEIDKFSKEHENAKIEVKDDSNTTTIFNPDSGRVLDIYDRYLNGVHTKKDNLLILLKGINQDEDFFKVDDAQAKAYKALAGSEDTKVSEENEEERLEFRDIWDDNY